jgi:GNAT superfamily N-acetyltransferase
MSSLPPGSVAARRADLSDAERLARLRWVWRTVERDEEGDWDRFQADFADWMAQHARTHVPFLVEKADAAVGTQTDAAVGTQTESAIGMAWLAVIDRVPGPQRWTRLSGAIQSVYVRAEERDGGAGSLLVRKLMEEARGEGLDYLSVHPSPRSYPFYRRLGFTGEGALLYLELGSP